MTKLAATEPTRFPAVNSNSAPPLSATRQRSPPHCRDVIIRAKEVVICGHFILHDENKCNTVRCDTMHI